MEPTSLPSDIPISQPSTIPSAEPSSDPSFAPIAKPSAVPSGDPSCIPSCRPSGDPSSMPSVSPSQLPSVYPSGDPSCQPTAAPSSDPTIVPSSQPSGQPTITPSCIPSFSPSPANMCCVSITIAPHDVHNIKEDLRIMATADSTTGGTLMWSVLELDDTLLAQYALSPTKHIFEAATLSTTPVPVNLVLPPHLLSSGTSYIFRLTFSHHLLDPIDGTAVTTHESIIVFTNKSPIPGVFVVVPLTGAALLDTFFFAADSWESTQLPLRYSFGFVSQLVDIVLPLHLPSHRTNLTTTLPGGNSMEGNALTCVLTVIDALGAEAEDSIVAQVVPGVFSRQSLLTAFAAIDADVSWVSFDRNFVPLLESMTTVNCSMTPDCITLNRQRCSSVAHTCGACLTPEHVGEDGHGNSHCYFVGAKSGTPVSAEEITSSENLLTHECTLDDHCPIFLTCLAGECVSVIKNCPLNCSGHGYCQHTMGDTLQVVQASACSLGSSECVAKCICEESWYGRDCATSELDMALDSNIYAIASCLLAERISSFNDEENLEAAVHSWINQIAMISNEPHRFTLDTGHCLVDAAQMTLGVVQKILPTIPVSTVKNLLSSVSAILDYHAYFDHDNHTRHEIMDILDMATTVVHSYCDVLSSVMVHGEQPHNVKMYHLRVASYFLPDPGNSTDVTEFNFAMTVSEVFNNVISPHVAMLPPVSGGYCLVSYGATAYKNLSNEVLKSGTLSILSSGKGGYDTKSSMFEIELESGIGKEILETTIPRVSFNVTCSYVDYGITMHLPCPNNVTKEVYCDADNVGEWTVSCPEIVPVVTCSRIQRLNSGVTTYPDDESCTLKTMTNSSVLCECPSHMLHSEISITINRAIEVEFGVIVRYKVVDLVSTLNAGGSSPFTLNSQKVFVTLCIFFVASGIALCHCNRMNKGRVGTSLGLKGGYSSAPIPDDVSHTDSFVTVDIDSLFPTVYKDVSFVLRFLNEVKKSNMWYSLCFSNDHQDVPRHMKVLTLFCTITVFMFFNSLLYSVLYPSGESCRSFYSEVECPEEELKLDSVHLLGDLKCHWEDSDDSAAQRCQGADPSSSSTTISFVTIIAAVLVIPFGVALEFVILELLCRPTVTSSETVSVAPTSTVNSITASTPHEALRSSSKVMPLADTRSAKQKLDDLISGLYSHCRQLHGVDRYRFESIWAMPLYQMEQHGSQRLGQPEPCTPQQRITNAVHIVKRLESQEESPPSSAIALTRASSRVGFTTVDNDFAMNNVLATLLAEIASTKASADVETEHMRTMSATEQRRHMLLLFQKDLLTESQMSMVEKKVWTILHYRNKVIGKRIKNVIIASVVLVIVLQIWYIVDFAVNESDAIQTAWLWSFVLWLFLEIFVVSVLETCLSRLIVPAIDYDRVNAMKNKMIATVNEYKVRRHAMKGISSSKVAPNDDRNGLDITPYFFVSSNVACRCPQVLESEIVELFRATEPIKKYPLISHQIFNALSVIDILKEGMHMLFDSFVAKSAKSVERGVYLVLIWLSLGMFVVWQASLFESDYLVAGLICGLILFSGFSLLCYIVLVTRRRGNVPSSGVIFIPFEHLDGVVDHSDSHDFDKDDLEAAVDLIDDDLVKLDYQNDRDSTADNISMVDISRVLQAVKNSPAYVKSSSKWTRTCINGGNDDHFDIDEVDDSSTSSDDVNVVRIPNNRNECFLSPVFTGTSDSGMKFCSAGSDSSVNSQSLVADEGHMSSMDDNDDGGDEYDYDEGSHDAVTRVIHIRRPQGAVMTLSGRTDDEMVRPVTPARHSNETFPSTTLENADFDHHFALRKQAMAKRFTTPKQAKSIEKAERLLRRIKSTGSASRGFGQSRKDARLGIRDRKSTRLQTKREYYQRQGSHDKPDEGFLPPV